jgi:hypothetical protein
MRELPASAEQYRRQPDENSPRARLRTQDAKLIEEANTVPIQRVLEDEFGIVVPGELSRSWKTNCPFGFEHPDGGVEKAMRVYGSNTAYCFSTHGMLTPVRLIQIKTERRAATAAKRLAERYGLRVGEPYWEKAKRLILERDEAGMKVGSPSNAVQALQRSLARVPNYETRQFDTDVTLAMEEQLEALDVAMRSRTPGAVREWLREATEAIRQQVGVE